MKICLSRGQNGDTMVEVLLATAVLSVVLAGAFTLTNRATRLNQTANERTQVSNLMQREVELLRAYHADDEGAFWSTFSDTNSSESANYCDSSTGLPLIDGREARYFDATGNVSELTAPGYNDGDVNDLFHVWIEPVDDGFVGFVDFFVYGCWQGIGGETVQQSGLVMRIAE